MAPVIAGLHGCFGMNRRQCGSVPHGYGRLGRRGANHDQSVVGAETHERLGRKGLSWRRLELPLLQELAALNVPELKLPTTTKDGQAPIVRTECECAGPGRQRMRPAALSVRHIPKLEGTGGSRLRAGNRGGSAAVPIEGGVSQEALEGRQRGRPRGDQFALGGVENAADAQGRLANHAMVSL